MQYEHFRSELAIFRLSPAAASRRFSSLVNFVSSVAHHYPAEAGGFPGELMGLLDTQAAVLESETRTSLVKALMSLSAKRLVPSVVLLPLCFKLFRVHDKDLRRLLYGHVVADIRRHNKNRKNVSLNKQLQNFMFTMLQDASQIAQKKSLDVMIELYRRGVWKDAKTVNVMAQACLGEGKGEGRGKKCFCFFLTKKKFASFSSLFSSDWGWGGGGSGVALLHRSEQRASDGGRRRGRGQEQKKQAARPQEILAPQQVSRACFLCKPLVILTFCTTG